MFRNLTNILGRFISNLESNNKNDLPLRLSLTITAFLLPLLLSNFLSTTNDRKLTSVDVIVVGAGFSGLGTAKVLHDAGVGNIRVLEAKNGLGGRVQEKSFGGITVGMGAGWIHRIDNTEAENPIWQLAAASTLRVHLDDYDHLVYR